MWKLIAGVLSSVIVAITACVTPLSTDAICICMCIAFCPVGFGLDDIIKENRTRNKDNDAEAP